MNEKLLNFKQLTLKVNEHGKWTRCQQMKVTQNASLRPTIIARCQSPESLLPGRVLTETKHNRKPTSKSQGSRKMKSNNQWRLYGCPHHPLGSRNSERTFSTSAFNGSKKVVHIFALDWHVLQEDLNNFLNSSKNSKFQQNIYKLIGKKIGFQINL